MRPLRRKAIIQRTTRDRNPKFLACKTLQGGCWQNAATHTSGKTVISCQPNGQRPPLLTNCNISIIKKYKTTRLPLMQMLKTVSGRLLKLLLGRDKSTYESDAARRTLLVVDDEESICFSMREYFSQHGFQVDTASEMEEAEGLIKATDYRVIIQDLRLGLTRHPDGIEIIKLVHKRNPETRIVVLTSYGSKEVEEEARRAGADAFLRKPKPLSQVAQVVQALIESPRARAVRA